MSIMNNPFDDEFKLGQMAYHDLLQQNIFLMQIIEDIKKGITQNNSAEPMPQIVISEISQNDITHEEFNLEQLITDCVSNNRKGLDVLEILKVVSVIKKDIDKSSINSCLYKMLNKKRLTKSSDKRPIWNIK